MTDIIKLSEYRDWLRDLKQQIRTGQIKAAFSVNSQMIMIYWDLGKQIVEKQEKAQWGSSFIEQLSKDLREEFPEMTGFSRTNLFRMKRFYQFYSPVIQYDEFVSQAVGQLENSSNEFVAQVVQQFVPQFVGQIQSPNNQSNTRLRQFVPQLLSIPWGHNVCIIEKVAVTNFNLTLPAPQSDLANELMKDPYNFDFLRLSEKVKETDLEKALVQHISYFLPELGIGFAYMGRQFSLKIGKKDYRTDLLFYHTRLKCYVIIELKTREFEPEFVGKLNFYITAINERIKDNLDKSTIGMLLCKNKDNYEVEFSLRDVNNPIGVSTFHYTELTDDIKAALPSAEELQNELLNFEREHRAK